MAAATITETHFSFPGQTAFAKGSVRDIYTIDNKYLVMVVTDRISTFDVLLPVAVPYKGQVLAQIAAHFLKATEDIIPNWFISTPDPNVVIGHKCEPYRIEVVIRGYLTGHAWREYKRGKRELCDVPLPEGLKENDKFPKPIITPATHAKVGHDEDISAKAIIKRGLVPAKDWTKIEKYALKLFQRGTELAAKQGLILVDTKYEFGIKDGQLMLIDEIHTPDSSRYFYADGYERRQAIGEPQKQLSKEFVREWLMHHGFQGQKGQTIPEIPEKFVRQISERYLELYEQLIGEPLVKLEPTAKVETGIEEHIRNALEEL